MKSVLYIMVGVPGSGKSYFAQKLQKYMDLLYISRDAVRLSIIKDDEHYFSHEKQVFNRFAQLVYDGLTNGQDVIADATHLNFPSRRKLVTALEKLGLSTKDYYIVYVVMKTPMATCVERDAKRTGRAHVTEEVIRDFGRNFRAPTRAEFDNVIGVCTIK